jgi:hypothetical protein
MTLSPEFLAAISQISKNLQQQRPGGQSSLAHGFLAGNTTDMRGSFNPGASQHGNSVLSRILDVVSRPLYAVSDAAYESADAQANHQSFLDQVKGLGTGVIHGLSGTQKRTWLDILQQENDIKAQRAATGDSAGYQAGQGNPLSPGEKIAGIGLNVLADPINKIPGPIAGARYAGAKTGLYELPTAGQLVKNLSQKAIAKGAQVGERESHLPLGAPDPTQILLDINPKAIAEAKSLPDVLHAKIGEPQAIQEIHPHVQLDPGAFNAGKLKVSELSDAGQFAADLLHESRLSAHRTAAPAAIKAASELDPTASWMKIVREYLGKAPNHEDAVNEIKNNAVRDLAAQIAPATERNKQWIADAVKNGIDPARAVRVVREVQNGTPFKEAFADAVGNSQIFKGAKIPKSGELKGITNPGYKLSAVLAPTAKEVLDAVSPGNPNAAVNAATLERAKQLASVKRVGALARPLGSADQAILAEVVKKAQDEIHGIGRAQARGALNDVVQANLWDNIRHRVAPLANGGAGNVSAINSRTFHIAAHAEAELERLGFKPIAGDGTPTRLTEAVAANSGYPNKLGPLTTKVINGFASGSLVGAAEKAEGALRDAKASEPVIASAALHVNQLFNDPNLSDPVKFLGKQQTAKDVEKAITMLTGSTTTARTGKAIYNQIVASGLPVTDAAVQRAGRALSEMVATGKTATTYDAIVRDLGESISKALETAANPIPKPKMLGTMIGAEARPEIGVLGRLATWYGQHDLRPDVQKRMSTARANAAIWAKYWHDTFDGLNAAQRVEAMRTAQGLFEAVDPKVIEAADRIRTRMENLLSSSQIKEAARQGNTVALRSALLRDGKYGLNAELTRSGLKNLDFTNKVVEDLFKVPKDYSKGTDWLNSWETFKFEGDPAKTLARIENAIFNAAAKKAIFDDIRDRFGSPLATSEHTHTLKDFPLLKGVYFPQEIAEQATRVVRDLYGAAPATSPLLRTMDNIIRMWKTGVTIYAPSHAIRNGMGDIYNNWIAGVNSTRPYAKAIKVMAASRHDYQSLENLGLTISQRNPMDQIGTAFGEVPGDPAILRTKDGQRLTASQIKMAAHNQGILLAVEHMEDIGDVNGGLGGLSKIQPFGGRVSNVAHGFVQGMDHFTRLAHFIHGVENGSGNLQQIFDAAGREVRKYHPDGMDLTGFERNVLRRVIPFYSWTRKAIPFSIEGMFAKPGKFMAYPKITTGLNYGNASNISPGQEFPSDQLFPSWITDMGIGPVGSPGGFLDQLTGGLGGYVTASPGIPPIDLLQGYANHPNQGILGGLNPFAKVPLELMQGQHIDTKIPIASIPEYLGEQVPIASLIQRLTNVGIAGTTAKGQQQGIGNAQALTNFITGLKLTNTGQYVKEAKYELHAKQTQQKKQNRQHLQDFLKGL